MTRTPPSPVEPLAICSDDSTRAPIAGWLRVLTSGPLQLRQLMESTPLRTAVALSDQGLVSATSLATSMLVGRFAGPGELGLYSLGFSIVILILSPVQSLVATPYAVYVQRLHPRRRSEYSGAVIFQTLLLAAMAVVGLLAFAVASTAGFGPDGLAPVVWVLSGAICLVMLRDLSRRMAYAHLRPLEALGLDLTACSLQLGGLAALAAAGLLRAWLAHAVLGIACGMAVAGWVAANRPGWSFHNRKLGLALRRNWRFGRWVLGGQLVSHLNSDILVLWVLAVLAGKEATGVFAACMTIALFSSPLIQGVGHVVTPGAARAFATAGAAGTWRFALHAALALATVMGLFVTAVLLLGDWALSVLYGTKYAGYSSTPFVLSLVQFVQAVGLPASSGLWAMERPELNFRTNLCGLVVTAAAVGMLVGHWHVLGVALALLMGHTAAVAFRWFLLWQRTKLEPPCPGT